MRFDYIKNEFNIPIRTTMINALATILCIKYALKYLIRFNTSGNPKLRYGNERGYIVNAGIHCSSSLSQSPGTRDYEIWLARELDLTIVVCSDLSTLKRRSGILGLPILISRSFPASLKITTGDWEGKRLRGK